MLKFLRLENVGPAPAMTMELAPRLNLITGDNGLGKSFLLDIAWWALTRRWPQEINSLITSGYAARPYDARKPASIEIGLESKTRDVHYKSRYEAAGESWLGKSGRPWNPGLVVYAQADGGFSVWDPARNYWKKKGNFDVQDRLPGYVFSPKEVWDGLKIDVNGRQQPICNGLLIDWTSWVREAGDSARKMEAVLTDLSPTKSPEDRLVPGPITRIAPDYGRDIPSLKTGYSDAVPILHASAGVRRAVALAYVLIWSWNEHRLAAERQGLEIAPQVIFLIDELESHLHPRWQRTILGSLLKLVEILHPSAKTQIVAATHSPLILASAEPIFDPDRDAWFDLDLQRGKAGNSVELQKRTFVRRGDVSHWLTSDAFDLKEPTSLEAEEAITQALALVREKAPARKEIEAVDVLLRKSLGDTDRFWMRWSEFRNRQGAKK